MRSLAIHVIPEVELPLPAAHFLVLNLLAQHLQLQVCVDHLPRSPHEHLVDTRVLAVRPAILPVIPITISDVEDLRR